MNVINWVAFGGILVDLVIISVFVSTAFWGYRKGLVNVAFKILTFLVSIIIVFVLYKPISNAIIKGTTIDDKIAASIYNILMGTTLEDGELLEPTQNNISPGVINLVNSFVTDALNQAKSNTVEYAAEQLSYMMVRFGTILLLFIISRFFLLLIKFAAELLGNLPIIRMFNKSGGLVYGVVKGFLIIYVILGILLFVSPFITDLGVIQAVEDSSLGSKMYNNNFIVNIIVK